MRSGATQEYVSDMKKLELYNISLKGGRTLFSALQIGEYMDRMEDLSIEYYQTGTPHPDEIITETYIEEHG